MNAGDNAARLKADLIALQHEGSSTRFTRMFVTCFMRECVTARKYPRGIQVEDL